ncbi:MAG: GIY-YIG nuclease family protein [Campylobacteraceae bacterium]|nr:GIY-YIG nuclease family protein [Campylobacteraceae bacterium]
MNNKIRGYVYILTNPSFRDDWIKIGKSSRYPDIRSKELDNTSVSLPYRVYATIKTVKFNEVEKLVHRFIKKLNPNLRIRESREFFNIKPEDAADIFEDISETIDDAEVEYWSGNTKVVSADNDNKQRKQGKLFSFYDKGLSDGDIIKFVDDKTITAAIFGKREVKFEDKKWKLSPLVYEIFKRKNELNSSGAYQGAAYFEFNGIKLKDLPDKELLKQIN